ncbi:MAG TPA: hypothetical protein GXX14_12040 [Clostridiaceae bacterium]|nr:hypothetical protein [Clostridiaceae bacterium]
MHISKSKIIIAIAVAIIVLISGSVLVVSLAGGNSASKQIELGNKYLMEGKYEEAILAFERAIKSTQGAWKQGLVLPGHTWLRVSRIKRKRY